MKTLHLTLKKGWFDMILSGEKKEEYREIKPYWVRRLIWIHQEMEFQVFDEFVNDIKNQLGLKQRHGSMDELLKYFISEFACFNKIIFRNGYSKNSPTIEIEFKGIEIGVGMYVLGAPNYPVFIIKLGKILATKNV